MTQVQSTATGAVGSARGGKRDRSARLPTPGLSGLSGVRGTTLLRNRNGVLASLLGAVPALLSG